ncbi:SDR family oxidoreductase [Adhaeribacter rhizoryzae]|uniref:NAD(P)H-binding protein n=1 Tax=Adhaeribacter rhizoryzae TaxID=2607907 RepID=A0A5M6DS53_9BACT|nr:NmrA family NAD(P)-binding protein [Adhaeribacter rhizoryzae]KAA5548235.1 NAD(P)H-binding protein [Adhaeribacter rhizoryzae]
MKTLIIGGTGTVGTQVVKYMLQAKQPIRLLTTSVHKAARLPVYVDPYVANLDEPETLTKAFVGIDKVFLLNPQGHTEVEQAINAVNAAQKAGVSKIVYQSIHRVRQGAHIPHFQTKIAIEEAIMASGLNYTFVCPNNFYQNDFWFKDAVSAYGIYPQPYGEAGLSRVDVRDIAEAAVKALFNSEYDGLSIPLAGPEALTGEDTAAILSEELGFKVNYGGNDLAAWAAQAKLILPAWIVDDWVQMYQFFQEKGLVATASDLQLLTHVLGRAPRSYAAFVREYAPVFQPESVTV